MIDTALQFIAPHHCYGCGKIGRPLCTNCKYDIVCEPFSGCVVCAQPAVQGICTNCQTSYKRAWCTGDRTDTLERVINAYKFDHVRAAAQDLVDLLDDTISVLPQNTVVVPVPTLSGHVRQRGFDHAALLARTFAKRRGLSFERSLARITNTHQRNLSKSQRFKAAKNAFTTDGTIQDTPYILIDDVLTTNATVRFAAQVLKDAGAREVWVAVVARQPLDKV